MEPLVVAGIAAAAVTATTTATARLSAILEAHLVRLLDRIQRPLLMVDALERLTLHQYPLVERHHSNTNLATSLNK